MGFFISILLKLVISSSIVLLAFSYVTFKVFLKQLFLFFAVSFCFAGVMLGIWLMFSPKGMTYYNGVVYFDISSFLLIITTIAAYAALTLANRFSKGGKLSKEIYAVTIYLGEAKVRLNGLVDTGNHLTEPFSGTPVVVCGVSELTPVLPEKLVGAVLDGKIFSSEIYGFGLRIRMVPYSNVSGSGVLPAFKADLMMIETASEKLRIENVYIGISAGKIGDERYSCLLTPELTGLDTKNLLTVVPFK